MRPLTVPGRPARILALAGSIIMVAMFAYGFVNGYLYSQATAIASIAWGQVLLADLFVGLALFGAWMAWREGPGLAAVIWILALLLLGNVVACGYVLHALHQSRGDGIRFWAGRRADGETPRG